MTTSEPPEDQRVLAEIRIYRCISTGLEDEYRQGEIKSLLKGDPGLKIARVLPV